MLLRGLIDQPCRGYDAFPAYITATLETVHVNPDALLYLYC